MVSENLVLGMFEVCLKGDDIQHQAEADDQRKRNQQDEMTVLEIVCVAEHIVHYAGNNELYYMNSVEAILSRKASEMRSTYSLFRRES